jgi:adenylate cyclase
MSERWEIRVYEDKELVYTTNLLGRAELGRQSTADETLYSQLAVGDRKRLVIASKDELSVSRQHALIEPLPSGSFKVTNLSAKQPVGLPDGTNLGPRASCTVAPDALLMVGRKTVRLQGSATASDPPIQGLAEATLPPGQRSVSAAISSLLPLSTAGGADLHASLRWLQATIDVLQAAASSEDFFDKAARAVVEMVNLDSCRVLLFENNEWRTRALQTTTPMLRERPWNPSRHVLQRVLNEKRTFFEMAGGATSAAVSLRDLEAVVAAPILNSAGDVIGALYGDRRPKSSIGAPGRITQLEATLVEVLARGVAAGLARMEEEKKALAAGVRFEQFFTPELAQELALKPDLLKGQDALVTLLFCDIRRFSQISEHLSPAKTVEWIGDVMETLSECVRAHAGVLVDYIGDELIAMWGAPKEQPDQAKLACRAALDMVAMLPKLNERWSEHLKGPMDLGIGINTGMAHVGNIGSRYKFKYGPLGNEVNLASRVQGATKYVKCRLLITGATEKLLDETFYRRRLCEARVVNIGEPVMLFELFPNDYKFWPDAKVEYERSFAEFEKDNFGLAARTLGAWRSKNPDDLPALLLLYRAVQCMVEGKPPHHPVWVLPGK